MSSKSLDGQEGKVGVLRFSDGHTVRAKLVHVDTQDRQEVIYDVLEVIDPGPARWAGVRKGTTATASLDEVSAFDP